MGLRSGVRDSLNFEFRISGHPRLALMERWSWNFTGAGALQIAERIRLRISQHRFAWEHCVATVTAGIGVVMFSPDIDHVETFITRTDHAMYQAKRRGRNRVELYHEECASKDQSG